MKVKHLKKELSACKHPNSRRTKALARRAVKIFNRNDNVKIQNLKWNIMAAKVQWFLDNIDKNSIKFSKEQIKLLIDRYLHRFDNELEQIAIKHSIGNRKNRQHANREDVINMTVKREQEEYNSSGLEIPNLLNSHELQLLKSWDGNLVSLQHMKLLRINERSLTP